MQQLDLEELVPGLRAARNRERRIRGAAMLGIPWTVCGVPCLPLTPRHRLELQLAGNAFASETVPTMADVFQILWRVNPNFRKPPTLRSRWHRWRLKRHLAPVNLTWAVREVMEYIAGMFQDMQGSKKNAETVSNHADYIHWAAAEFAFFSGRFGMPFAEYMDTPIALIHQLDRATSGEREDNPNFINASDRLVDAWIASMRRHEPQN